MFEGKLQAMLERPSSNKCCKYYEHSQIKDVKILITFAQAGMA
jgi:hypothetical protein